MMRSYTIIVLAFASSVKLVLSGGSVALGAEGCRSNTDCTSGSGGTYAYCNHILSLDYCDCISGFKDSNGALASGECKPELGATCGDDTDCIVHNENSTCDSVCKCLTGFADSNGGSCAPDLGTWCSDDTDCISINPNAKCDASKCECSTGYTDSNGVNTVGGDCYPDLGTACSDTCECSKQNEFSECSSSICTCRDMWTDSNGDNTPGGTCVFSYNAGTMLRLHQILVVYMTVCVSLILNRTIQ